MYAAFFRQCQWLQSFYAKCRFTRLAWQLELLERNRGIGATQKKGCEGAEPPRYFLETTPFSLAIDVTSAFLHIRIALEKHEKVTVLESKEKTFVTCWQ